MNANELIESLRNKLFGQYHGGTKYVTEITISERDDIIRALSRTRIRETATEPPTREDADKSGWIIGYDTDGDTGHKHWTQVARFPSLYPHWTKIQQLSEVTP